MSYRICFSNRNSLPFCLTAICTSNNSCSALTFRAVKDIFVSNSMCHKEVWWLSCHTCLSQLCFKPASLYFVRRTWKSTFSMLKGCISYSSCHVKTSIYCLWVVSYFLDVLCVAFHEPTFHQTWMTPILFCISSPYQVLLLFHSIVFHNSKRKISNTYSRKRLCFKYLYKFYSYLLYLNKREELQF